MLSNVQLFAAPWAVARQTFAHGIFQARILEQVLFPNPDLPNPGIEPESFVLPALAGRFFTTSAIWEAHIMVIYLEKRKSTFLYYPTKYSAYLYVSVYLETKMYNLTSFL